MLKKEDVNGLFKAYQAMGITIEILKEKHPNLEDEIKDKVFEAAKKGKTQCIIYNSDDEQRNMIVYILINNGYRINNSLQNEILVDWS